MSRPVDVLAVGSNYQGILGSSSEPRLVPAGMVEVTKEEFWAAVHKTPLNVHPCPERRHTDWIVLGTRQRWGWVSSGFSGPFEHEGIPERFALARIQGGAA